MAIESADLASGHENVGRFAIEKELGRDGAGVVYQATDERTRRRVALRVLPDSLRSDPARRERAIADARAIMGVEHPSLAPIVDVGETAGALFVASELAEGTSLRDRVARTKLDLASALRIATDVTSAIAALHREGLAHGALDAGRVIVDDAGGVKVVALGIAELAASRDPRDDVRAIATLLKESIDWRSAPTSLDALVRHAADPDPARRPADADALLADLARIDLPTTPVGEAAAEQRADVLAGASRAWIVGASIALAVVIAFGLFVIFAMTSR